MGRGFGDYTRDFVRNLRSERLSGRWVRRLIRNRVRARIAFDCCGHPGEPGC
ncbi:MAG TPA: hypothetical protein VE962_07955 [Actinomycetota bacterium]|jgi:hypothetical protein|nr:hypothetical protein [Actinomycetota bacterium]